LTSIAYKNLLCFESYSSKLWTHFYKIIS
jgi:hypothetical protein